jgi:wyosine [tRNA(Phe)-imidazoG37] synthetase (radical SAM superfamily)
MLLPLQRGIIYGPVQSRRLGRSLGINVLPSDRKACNFDCRYCQYGWTDRSALDAMTESDYPAVPEILDALSSALRALLEPPRYLTFSGNGEATLHPRFGEIVDGVNAIRDRLVPQARTAILSNSSRAMDREIREALMRLDVRIMKLDCGTEGRFARFNRPVGGITIESITEGLRALPDTTLQTLLVRGTYGNLDDAELDAWLGRVGSIRPRRVQLYTLDRKAPDQDLVPATREQLEKIRTRVAALGIEAEVF